jgi:hypothetical protein
VRIPLVRPPRPGAGLAGVCLAAAGLAAAGLAGFITACSVSPHPAAVAPAAGPPGAIVPAAGPPAGVAPAVGTLTGHLYGVGGPPPGAPRPWPGTITLTGPGMHRDIQVGPGGRFSVLVPAGTYAVAGRSPLYQSSAGSCRAARPAVVIAGHRTQADVLCQMR